MFPRLPSLSASTAEQRLQSFEILNLCQAAEAVAVVLLCSLQLKVSANMQSQWLSYFKGDARLNPKLTMHMASEFTSMFEAGRFCWDCFHIRPQSKGMIWKPYPLPDRHVRGKRFHASCGTHVEVRQLRSGQFSPFGRSQTQIGELRSCVSTH